MWKRNAGPRTAARNPLDSPEFWRSLVDSVPDMVLLVDCDGTVLYVNHVPSGLTREAVIGPTRSIMPRPRRGLSSGSRWARSVVAAVGGSAFSTRYILEAPNAGM